MNKPVGLAFIFWRTITLAALGLGTILLPINTAFTIYRDVHYPDFGFTLPYWLTAWGNFDAFHYLGIAKRGYFVTELPFFPLYPFVIALMTQILKSFPYLLSALVISHVTFIWGLIVSIKLLILDGKRSLVPLFLAAVITFPTSYSYGAAYNDSLFFLLATLTLYWSRVGKWWPAGIAGALATLTRLNGLALFAFLMVEYARERHRNGKRIHAILLVPAALGSYLFYIQHVFGSWTKLFSAMSTWGQDRMVLPVQVFWRYGKILLYTPLNQLVWWVALVELGSVLFYLAMLVWSWKKIRTSYWIFFAVSILIPSLTGTFQGMPRYGLHLYPLFLVIALFLSQQSRLGKALYFLVMLALLIFCVVLFTRGYFIT